jgi:Na+/H+ antiporter NhaD/arsenite permease-like protein
VENWQAFLSFFTFFGVILLVITEWIHLTIAALLGALLLVFANVMN